MPKTKILGICQHFYPEMVSTGLHMTELFSGLSDYDENVCQIFCTYPIKKEYEDLNPPKKEIYKGIAIHRTHNFGSEHKSIFQRLVYNILFVIKACTFAIRQRNTFDKILLTTDPPFIGIIPLIINKLFGKPYALIIYDVYPDIAIKLDVLKENSFVANFWNWINKKVYLNATSLIVIGEDMKKIILEKLPTIQEEKISLIHNWSDSREIMPIKKTDNVFLKKHLFANKRILLYSGNMGRTHNIESILTTAKDLEKSHPDVLFLFIGGGVKKQKVQAHIDNKTSSNVQLLPFQPFEILAHVLSSPVFSWVCLDDDFTGMSVPSKSYGIMASGTPIVGLLRSDSEISTTITKHNLGVVWNNTSSITLTELVTNILEDTETLKIYGQNARKAFLENFDLKISISKYNALIKKI